jgi:hypothetical protein
LRAGGGAGEEGSVARIRGHVRVEPLGHVDIARGCWEGG